MAFRQFHAVIAGLTAVSIIVAVLIFAPVDRSKNRESPVNFDQLVSEGQRVLESARCGHCHIDGKSAPAPDLSRIGERTPKPAELYIAESILDPDAFVADGYPAGQHPIADLPPISLSSTEIRSLICYLLSRGATLDRQSLKRVDDAIERLFAAARKTARKPKRPLGVGDSSRGKDIFRKNVCFQCHRIAGEGADVCPDLSEIGAIQPASYILNSILVPNEVIVKGYDTIRVFKKNSSLPITGALVRLEMEPPATKIVLSVNEGGKQAPWEIPLAEVKMFGSSTVAVLKEGDEDDAEVFAGEIIKENEDEVVLKMWQEGNKWMTQRFAKEKILALNRPLSPMPGNFVESFSQQEIDDLVAYLVSLKGKPNGAADKR